LLAHTDYVISVVPCVRDGTLPKPCESFAETDPELHRYQVAGANTVARYAFPGTGDTHDAFFQIDVMQDFSHAVVIEGDCPVSFADVTAFVASAVGGRLLVRRKSDQPSRDRQAMDAWEAVLSRSGGLESALGALIGPGLGEFALRHAELVERERRKALTQLVELRSRPVAKHRMRWAVADAYQGVERAQLVVVNIRDDDERRTRPKPCSPRWPGSATTGRSAPKSWDLAAAESPSPPSSPTSPTPPTRGRRRHANAAAESSQRAVELRRAPPRYFP
jgi:hypothetical protein